MKKQVISILFSIILIFALKNTCDAASASISCDTSATVGKEITISANVTGVMWNLELKVNGETIAKNNELENYESNKTVTFSGKYTPKAEGNLTVTLTGTVTEFSDGSTIREFGSKTITVKAPVVETPKEPEKPSTDNNNKQPETPPVTTVTKSSEARLKNFGINPKEYDFSGFSKNTNKEDWSAEVPNSVSEVEIYAEPKDDNATIEGTGKVSLKEGNNTFEVKVTAEDGKTTKTYKLTIKRRTAAEEAKTQSEARLKSLGIKPEEYDFSGFDSEKTEYSVEIPSDVEEIEIYATAVNSNSQITGTGMITLEKGDNTLTIEVISENGTKKTYTIEVTRTEAIGETEDETEEKFGLKILTVQGLTLSPKFNTEIYEYTINLDEDVDSLEIGTRPTDDTATVEIVGNENLQEGENIITILVTNKETEEIATYQIVVNKTLQVEEVVVTTSWLKPSTWGKEEKIKIAIIIVLIILIIWAVILKIKISKESDNNKNVDFPGADELDKAIAEHQELSEESNSNTDNIEENNEKSEGEQNYIEEIAKNKFGVEETDFQGMPKRKGRHF